MGGGSQNRALLQEVIDGPRVKRARCGCMVDKDLRLVTEPCTVAEAWREVRESAQRCWLVHVHDLGGHHHLTSKAEALHQEVKTLADEHHTTAVSFA